LSLFAVKTAKLIIIRYTPLSNDKMAKTAQKRCPARIRITFHGDVQKNHPIQPHALYKQEVCFYTAVIVMPIGKFDFFKGDDPLDILVGRHDQHHTPSNYARLFQLARLNTTWRNVVRTNVHDPLLLETKKTMLNIALLYETANTFATPLDMHNYLKAIVKALLFFQKLKDDIMHLDLVTALHTACCSAEHVSEPRLIEEITTAGGVEAVIGTMVMNTSSLPLDIVCIRMLAKLRQYRKVDDVTWGWWTTRQSKTAVRVILDAMRKFPLSLDLQCCGMSCLALLCCLTDEPDGDRQYYTCRTAFVVEGGLQLAVGVMHANNHATLHVNICKLIQLFVAHVSWKDMSGGMHGNNVLSVALQNSVATDTQLESTLVLIELIVEFTRVDRIFEMDMCDDVPALSVFFQVLQRMLERNDTETSAQAVEKHNIIRVTVELLLDLVLGSLDVNRNILLIPNSFNVLIQILAALHDLVSAILSPLHLHHQPGITCASCHKIQSWICRCLVLVGKRVDISEYLFHAGALPVLFRIIEHTTNISLRSEAVQVATCISIKDNTQTLRILRAGGLEILADMLRRIKISDCHTSLHAIWLLEGLAAMPVYAIAMQRLGFVKIIQDLSWCKFNTNAFVERLEAAAKYPVDL